MSETDPAAQPPIIVRESPTKDVLNSSLRVFLLAGFAGGASWFIKSEVALAAIIPAGALITGFVATYLVGIHKLLQNHRKLRFLAKQVSDDVAKVK